MTTAVQLQVETSYDHENIVVIANSPEHFAQLLHTWLKNEKVGEEFTLVNNSASENEVYWLDSGRSKEGYVAVQVVKTEQLEDGATPALEGEIFTNEQDYKLTTIHTALELNGVKQAYQAAYNAF